MIRYVNNIKSYMILDPIESEVIPCMHWGSHSADCYPYPGSTTNATMATPSRPLWRVRLFVFHESPFIPGIIGNVAIS